MMEKVSKVYTLPIAFVNLKMDRMVFRHGKTATVE
jgi:hypothetical protein